MATRFQRCRHIFDMPDSDMPLTTWLGVCQYRERKIDLKQPVSATSGHVVSSVPSRAFSKYVGSR